MPPQALQVDRPSSSTPDPATRRESSPQVMPPSLSTKATDAELVARLALGEELALGELYDRHSAVAYGLARAIVRDAADAEEVVADCFAQMWRTAASFDPARGSVAAWASTIVRTRALDLIRAQRRRARVLDDAATMGDEEGAAGSPTPADTPDRDVERAEARQLVRRSLAELPPPQRRVLELAYFGGMSQSEIAELLSEPLGTVKTRMRAGLDKLRTALRPIMGAEALP
ncbi:MAG: sigma-70 family RNA polymerase sigma factor [Gemmatimonadaceae bacterium]